MTEELRKHAERIVEYFDCNGAGADSQRWSDAVKEMLVEIARLEARLAAQEQEIERQKAAYDAVNERVDLIEEVAKAAEFNRINAAESARDAALAEVARLEAEIEEWRKAVRLRDVDAGHW